MERKWTEALRSMPILLPFAADRTPAMPPSAEGRRHTASAAATRGRRCSSCDSRSTDRWWKGTEACSSQNSAEAVQIAKATRYSTRVGRYTVFVWRRRRSRLGLRRAWSLLAKTACVSGHGCSCSAMSRAAPLDAGQRLCGSSPRRPKATVSS